MCFCIQTIVKDTFVAIVIKKHKSLALILVSSEAVFCSCDQHTLMLNGSLLREMWVQAQGQYIDLGNTWVNCATTEKHYTLAVFFYWQCWNCWGFVIKRLTVTQAALHGLPLGSKVKKQNCSVHIYPQTMHQNCNSIKINNVDTFAYLG